jgi:hypothetical protein
MTDKRFTNSQSPRASRASTEDPDRYGKGAVRQGIRPINKTGGEGNEGAWEQSSPLRVEDINGPAAPTRRSVKKGV